MCQRIQDTTGGGTVEGGDRGESQLTIPLHPTEEERSVMMQKLFAAGERER